MNWVDKRVIRNIVSWQDQLWPWGTILSFSLRKLGFATVSNSRKIKSDLNQPSLIPFCFGVGTSDKPSDRAELARKLELQPQQATAEPWTKRRRREVSNWIDHSLSVARWFLYRGTCRETELTAELPNNRKKIEVIQLDSLLDCFMYPVFLQRRLP